MENNTLWFNRLIKLAFYICIAINTTTGICKTECKTK